MGEPLGQHSRFEIRADNRRFRIQAISRPRRARREKIDHPGGSHISYPKKIVTGKRENSGKRNDLFLEKAREENITGRLAGSLTRICFLRGEITKLKAQNFRAPYRPTKER
jgi:hypothetical protein